MAWDIYGLISGDGIIPSIYLMNTSIPVTKTSLPQKKHKHISWKCSMASKRYQLNNPSSPPSSSQASTLHSCSWDAVRPPTWETADAAPGSPSRWWPDFFLPWTGMGFYHLRYKRFPLHCPWMEYWHYLPTFTPNMAQISNASKYSLHGASVVLME